jgi:hypothetical protein
MSPSNDIPDKTGWIIVNLQALEFALRLFLHELNRIHNTANEPQFDFMNLSIGEWIPENYITNYDTLNQLIQKVNFELNSRGLSERIDDQLVELRDALAHGRVIACNPKGPYRILKFSKPKNGKVKVTVLVEVTPDWLSQQIRRTSDELLKLIKLAQTLGLNCFSVQ